MRKIRCFFLLLGFPLLLLQAQQEDCEKRMEKVSELLFEKSPFEEQKNLMSLVRPCAEQGNPIAENYLGMFYLVGTETEKNYDKAFKYISRSARKGYANAQYNLGRLYKYGIGCELNFKKAIQWFQIASRNGNQRAAYTLGYMYFKGYGVSQNYENAVHWFEQSTDVMAIHYLGLCYYLGYGVPVNESKAMELLLNNNTLNSKTLASYIKSQQKEKNRIAVEEGFKSTNDDSVGIERELISGLDVQVNQDVVEKEFINGEWDGKLIQYDWSGQKIERIVPLSFVFTFSEEDAVEIKATIDGKDMEAFGQWEDEKIYLDGKFKFNLDRLYPDNPDQLSLEYTTFTLGFNKKEFKGTNYLTGYMDTFIESWTEYGRPMSFVMHPKGNNENLDIDMLKALAQQDDQFIKLYPVPFKNSLTVQYQLEYSSEVFVELVGLHNPNHTTILPKESQNKGEYTYTIPVDTSLPEGYYVVRLIAGDQMYTRLILKEK